jgi:TolB protein
MKTLKILFAVFLICPLFCFARNSDVYIGISSKYDPNALPKIALGSFKYSYDAVNAQENANLITNVLRSDLMRTRYFELEESLGLVDTKNLVRSLSLARTKKADYLLFGEVSPVKEDSWEVKAFLYDTQSQKAVLAKKFISSAKGLRRSAHTISDQIVKLLYGKRGIADTKIAFSNDSTGRKEIYMVDYDGYNLVKLTKDNSIALLPRWNSDGTKIFYTTYRNRNPDIFYIDLKAGLINPLLKGGGLNLIGGVSPDDSKIVFTMSRGENASIYIKELDTGNLKQLTDKYGVDGSPSFSPDGKFVTYVSNRSGNPQIYVLDLLTKQTRRLTKFNWADTPQWSPTGEWIVFSGRQSPNHPNDIFIVDITGAQIRQLTADSGDNEDPSWSPDGRFITFTTTRSGKRQIYVMDGDGSAQHLVANIKGNSYTPSWSK